MNTVVLMGPQKVGKTKLLSSFQPNHDYNYTVRLADEKILPDIFFVEFGSIVLHKYDKDLDPYLVNDTNNAKLVVILYTHDTFDEVRNLYSSNIKPLLSKEAQVWFVKNNDPSLGYQVRGELQDKAWVEGLEDNSNVHHYEISTEDQESRLSFLNSCKREVEFGCTGYVESTRTSTSTTLGDLVPDEVRTSNSTKLKKVVVIGSRKCGKTKLLSRQKSDPQYLYTTRLRGVKILDDKQLLFIEYGFGFLMNSDQEECKEFTDDIKSADLLLILYTDETLYDAQKLYHARVKDMKDLPAESEIWFANNDDPSCLSTKLQTSKGENWVSSLQHISKIRHFKISTKDNESCLSFLNECKKAITPDTDTDIPTVKHIPSAAVESTGKSITKIHTSVPAKPKKVVVIGPRLCGKSKLLSRFNPKREYSYTLRLMGNAGLEDMLFVEYGFGFLMSLDQIECEDFSKDIRSADLLLILYTDHTFISLRTLYMARNKDLKHLPVKSEIWFAKNNDPNCAIKRNEPQDENWVKSLQHTSQIRHLEISTEDNESRLLILNQCKKFAYNGTSVDTSAMKYVPSAAVEKINSTGTNVRRLAQQKKVVVIGPRKCGKTKLLSKWNPKRDYIFSLRIQGINVLENFLFVEYGFGFLMSPDQKENQEFSDDIRSADLLLILYTDDTLFDLKTLYISRIKDIKTLPQGSEIWFAKNNDPNCIVKQVESEGSIWVSSLEHNSTIRHFEMSTEDHESRRSFLNRCKQLQDPVNIAPTGTKIRPIA